MNRLARLMPFRRFGRLHHLRRVVPCAALEPAAPTFFGEPCAPAAAMSADPVAMPAFARVSLNSTLHAQTAHRAPVRVYHGTSRVIFVGTIDAVCRMIDRCIDEERAGLRGAQPAR